MSAALFNTTPTAGMPGRAKEGSYCVNWSGVQLVTQNWPLQSMVTPSRLVSPVFVNRDMAPETGSTEWMPALLPQATTTRRSSVGSYTMPFGVKMVWDTNGVEVPATGSTLWMRPWEKSVA